MIHSLSHKCPVCGQTRLSKVHKQGHCSREMQRRRLASDTPPTPKPKPRYRPDYTDPPDGSGVPGINRRAAG